MRLYDSIDDAVDTLACARAAARHPSLTYGEIPGSLNRLSSLLDTTAVLLLDLDHRLTHDAASSRYQRATQERLTAAHESTHTTLRNLKSARARLDITALAYSQTVHTDKLRNWHLA
ncbi:hypothetical protein IQ251_14100 [Saccharopolyspora sp. HNM0983]|uniref:Uncharacterized protein n=1 Tax=Saccharopolyspora montiporae TaxID=2781240 RepID=A0A929BCM7_9PSEU|nr:hypothetical protein [Saccharopolyspora sp. HNM0983]MBE9375581.1 hypothetical protein [Saccharopolyspora sp. HNM0983]